MYRCEIMQGSWKPYGLYATELKGEFSTVAEALLALKRWHSRKYSFDYPLRVLDKHGNIVWEGTTGSLPSAQAPRQSTTEEVSTAPDPYYGDTSSRPVYWATTIITSTAGGNMNDIASPLHIPRTALIGRLNEVRDAEIKTREDAQAAAAASRQSLLTKVEALTTDQVANVLHNFVNSSVSELEKWLDDVTKAGKFVSKDVAPTSKETQLDKTIRVLELASDTDIEIQPNDPIFPLL